MCDAAALMASEKATSNELPTKAFALRICEFSLTNIAPSKVIMGSGMVAMFGDSIAAPEKADLCHVFGHGSSRNYAATRIPSSACLVRSKNESIACAGTW